jgi:copper homeostasis protein
VSAELEICCYCIEDALLAEWAGADRIALCAGRLEGGTTPSLGTLERARAKLDIAVFPMVRARGGDFVAGPDEFAAMCRDVEVIADLGFPGLAFGLLRDDDRVDVERSTELVQRARAINPQIGVNFHRAFDFAVDPLAAYADIARIGADRILTSGSKVTAFEGKALLAQLVELETSNSPKIMPGGGVRPENVSVFLTLGASEIHSSALPDPDSPIDPTMVEQLAAIVHAS